MNNSNRKLLILRFLQKKNPLYTKTFNFPLVLRFNLYLLHVPKIIVSYLIIYTLISANLNAQNLELKMQGKSPAETSILDSLSIQKVFKDYESLSKVIDSTLLILQRMGYIESEVTRLLQKNDSLFISEFNLKKKYNSINVYYTDEFLNNDILETISDEVTDTYFRIPIAESESAMAFLNQKVSEMGMPFTSFQLNNIRKLNETDLKGELVVSGTTKRKINSIIIKGYEKFPKSFLRRYLNIKSNQEFNLTKIKSKTKNLNSLSFANQIKDPEVLFTTDSTSLYLYLEKSKSNTFDGFLGFGNNETTNKIEFDGYLNLNLTNNLNYGESFSLIYKSDENEQRNFNVNTNLPYLFNSPVGLDLNLNIFKKDSTFTIVNQSAKIYYTLNQNNKIYGGIEYINSENLLDEATSPSNVNDYNSTFFNASFEYSKRTSYSLFPIQSFFFLEGGIGKRDFDNLKQDQTSIRFKSFKIFHLNYKNSIYLNVNGDVLLSDFYFFNELKRFGGINSIRGFEENSLYASLYSVINSEYRYSINKTIYIHSIIDAAYYEDDINQLKEKLFGFGFGLGIATKSGLLKLNYANGFAENQPFKFSNSKIHISLNAFF